MYGKIFDKIRNSIDDYSVSDATIARIIYECFDRMDFQEVNKSLLLDDGIVVEISDVTGDINIIDKEHAPFGIFWSFDIRTGELVGT